MGATVAFNYPAWVARYPELSSLNESLVALYFAEATIYHRNDGGGPVADATTQTVLLNMLTAHIAAINGGVNGQAPSPLVGNVSSAGEGSVNVSVTNDYPPGTPQWFQQTKYGAAYWAATAQYRTFRFAPGRQRRFSPPFPV